MSLGPQRPHCRSCGDAAPRVGADGLCALCDEVEARVEAQVAAIVADLLDRAVEVALDYLHADDVRAIASGCAEDAANTAPRLETRFARARARSCRSM